MMATSNEFLVWNCGKHLFGLELAKCQEIVNDVRVTRLPRSPHFVRGLTNLRGNVIAVVDLEVLLGYGEKSGHKPVSSIIRVRTGGYPLAIAFDTIRDTVFLGEKELEAIPANLTESESTYLSKVAKTRDGLVLVPNLQSINSKNN